MKKIFFKISTVFFVAAVVAACATTPPVVEQEDILPPVVEEGGEGIGDHMVEAGVDLNDPNHPLFGMFQAQARFPVVSGLANPNPAVDGGVLRIAMVSPTPIPGILGAFTHSTSVLDSNVQVIFSGGASRNGTGFWSSTPALQLGQHGAVTWTYDVAERSITVTMVPDDIRWHDGVPLTLDDLVFSFEVIADPDYDGIRWTAENQNIVGIVDFHNGLVDHIPGLVLSDDNRELKMYFYEFPPSMLHFGFWTSPLPRHIFGDVPVAEIADHYHSRIAPIGWGPFIVQNVVPGESVHLVANENFWLGRPYLDEIIMQVVSDELVPSMLQQGEFDISIFPNQFFPDHSSPTNFHYLGDITNVFSIWSFNLGHMAEDGTSVVTDLANAGPVGDVRMRRALGFGVNELELTDGYFHGLRFPATTIIPPGHSVFMDSNLTGFNFDPERANAYLDDAGFLDIDGDGFREDQNGEQMTLQLLVRAGEEWNILSQFYMQQWADNIGVRVELYQGMQHEFASIIAGWNADQFPNVHIREAAWSAGFNPDPNGLWGQNVNNQPRFMNDRLAEILSRFSDERAWDQEFLIQAYHDWQQAFYEYASAIPTNWRLELTAVNNRVLGYYLGLAIPEDGIRTRTGWHHVQVTTHTPYTH